MATSVITEINEREIRYFYQLLNHGDLASRMHCQGKDGALSSTLVKGEDAVVAWAKEWNGKGQCYISRNPMLEWGRAGKFTCLTFDIDPHYDKKLGASHVENQAAIEAGRRVLANYPGGVLATSGNGVLLLYQLPQDISEYLNGTLQPAYRRLIEEIKATLEKEAPVNVDVLADPERLLRLIGTKNVKGVPENHRMAKFLYLPQPGQAARSPILARLKALAQAPTAAVAVQTPSYEPWVSTALEGLPAGQKHVTIIKLAGYFGGKHIPIEITKKLILEANAKAHDEPAMEDDVIYRIDDVYKRIKQGKYNAESYEQEVEQVSNFEVSTFNDQPEIYLRELRERSVFKTPEIPWPFDGVNEKTWGLPRGALVALGAWTGKGKTSIAITVSEFLNRTGKRVLYFPTEMSKEEIKGRYISVATGIFNIHMTNGQVINHPDEKKKFDDFYPSFLQRPFFMPRMDRPRLNVDELKRALDKSNPDLLVVDYLQRLGTRSNDRRREVGEFIMTLKDEVQKRKTACLVLSQFHRPSRAANGRFFPPALFDFAECGDIENTSDISILLHPPLDEKGYIIESSDGERVKPVLCNVAKNRHGGTTGTVFLQVDTLTTKVFEA